MSKILYRWGRSAARHPWRMIFAWLVVVIAVVGLQRSIGDSTSDKFNIPGTEAQRGIDLLNDRFPSQGGSTGQVVFADPDGDVTDATARQTIAATLAKISENPDVVAVTDPFDPQSAAVSPDGRVAYATVHYNSDPPTKGDGEAAKIAVDSARQAGLRIPLRSARLAAPHCGSPPVASWIVEIPASERATDAISWASSSRYSPRSASSGSP